jgi:exodeoxyribonuclease VII small subunit
MGKRGDYTRGQFDPEAPDQLFSPFFIGHFPRMAKPAKPPASFEDTLAELEGIVQAMESEPLSLEIALERYQRGVALLKSCQDTLARAEERIRVLDGGALQPLDEGQVP